MKKLLTLIIVFISLNNAIAQVQDGTTCLNSECFCTDIPSYVFTAGVNQPSIGNYVGCLGTTPNPKWYHMQVAAPGNINIKLWSTNPDSVGSTTAPPYKDIDYIIWGPFDSLSQGCVLKDTIGGNSHGPSQTNACATSGFGGYPAGANLNIADCSYAADPIEYIHIQNAVAGKWYILLLTNFSNDSCDIHMQSQLCNANDGWTNCALLFDPPIGDTVFEGETAFLYADSIPGSIYYEWEGPGGFDTIVTNATLAIPNATTTMTGYYEVTVYYLPGRVALPQRTHLLVKPNLPNSIKDDMFTNISVFPNPANDIIFLTLDKNQTSDYQINIMNLSGKVIIQKQVKSVSEYSINIESLDNGIYIIECKGKNIYRGRFVKNKQ